MVLQLSNAKNFNTTFPKNFHQKALSWWRLSSNSVNKSSTIAKKIQTTKLWHLIFHNLSIKRALNSTKLFNFLIYFAVASTFISSFFLSDNSPSIIFHFVLYWWEKKGDKKILSIQIVFLLFLKSLNIALADVISTTTWER